MRLHRKYRTKKMVMTAAMLLAITCLSGCTNERKENELAYRQIGIDCMENGDYAGAVEAFDAALSYCLGTIGETELDICYYKAAAQYASGDAEGALKTYDALIAYNEKDADAYYTRGCLHLQRGESELAFSDFSNAIENNQDDYELYINIYKNLAVYNLTEQGTEYLNQALEIKGDDGDHLTYRGEIYLLLGDYSKASTELAAALEKGNAHANYVMAQVLEAQGDVTGAESYYNAYIESGEADAKACNAMAEIYMAKNDYATALSYIEQGLALERVPNKRELMQNQIICMEYTSDFTGAWKVIQEYIALYPNDLEIQREYIFLKNRQESVSEDQAIQAEVDTGVGTTESAESTEMTEGTEADATE